MELRRRRQSLVIALFALSAVLSQFDRQSIAILKPLLAADLGWSDGDYATVVACYQGASAVALLFTGWIVDRISLRSAGAITVIGWSIALIAHGWMRTVAEACVCRIALGMFQGLALPGGVRILSEILSPARRALGFGITNAAVTAGGVIAPLLLPLAALQWGWRGTFVGLGLVGLVWSLVWLRWFRDPPIRDAAVPARARTVAPAGVGRIIGNRSYRQIALCKTLADLTWWTTLFWMPHFFNRRFGLTVIEAGGPIALAYILCAAGALAFGALTNRMIASGCAQRQAHISSLGLALICVLPLPAAAFSGNPWVAALLLGIALFGHQGFSITIFAIIAEQAKPGELGRLTGFCAFCGQLGGTVVVKLVGSMVMAGIAFGSILLALPLAYALSFALLRRLPDRSVDSGLARA